MRVFDSGFIPVSNEQPIYKIDEYGIYDVNASVYTKIGTVANEIELNAGDTNPATATTNATFAENAVVISKPSKPANCPIIGAFWYQDFGLEYRRVNGPTWNGWYDWRWNFKSQSAGFNYYQDRHPMLGWYHGEDLQTLAWQSKWLLQHGVDYSILQTGNAQSSVPNTATWNTSASLDYWAYQLFNNVNNVSSSGLKLSLWLPYSITGKTISIATWASAGTYTIGDIRIDTTAQRQYTAITNHSGLTTRPALDATNWVATPMPSEWADLVTLYNTYKTKIATFYRSGTAKTYAIVYLHSCEAELRAPIYTGTFNAWMAELGSAMNSANPSWDGVCVIARNSSSPAICDGVSYGGVVNYDTLETNRCLLVRGDYEGIEASYGASASYQSLIDTYPAFNGSYGYGQSRRAYGVPTSSLTVPPHGSSFNKVGHSPTKFKEMMQKVLAKQKADNSIPLLTIYNVSEWAEGGPGLQPNKQDGFGYLTALKESIDSY